MTSSLTKEDIESTPQCKIVVVGDGAIGKTCLLTVYTAGEFPEEYVPTVFDNYTELKEVSVKDNRMRVRLDLWDTAGQEEFDRIRPLSYRDANYFLIAFSVMHPESFQHAKDKWIPEIRHHAPHKNFLLVGLKSDLRKCPETIAALEAEGEQPVEVQSVYRYVREIGADGYVESSAKRSINVDLVFETAMKKYFTPRKKHKKQKKCLIM